MRIDSARLALVHEWIDARDGSVKTFEQMAAAFPQADLYALTHEPGVPVESAGRPIHTTRLDTELLRGHRDLTLPAMPLAWRTLAPQAKYDLVISSHHAFAQTNRLAGDAIHLGYVYTPARYLWTPELDGRGANLALAPARAMLRAIDRRSTRRVAGYAAISTTIADRIGRFWNRPSTVIPPPVDVDYYGATTDVTPSRDFVLGVGRWIPYKNLHLVIEVADRLGLPAKIAGRGPERGRILAAAEQARVPVEIIEAPSDERLRDLYRNAAVLVFPTIEDFGIVPVEAQSAGTPVAAVGIGGALDTVVPAVTGALAPSLDVIELAEAAEAAMRLDPKACRDNAARFTTQRFVDGIREWAASHLG